jgi:hypothetical protein
VKKNILITVFLLACMPGHTQVLISLIFGKSLNSGKVEFGLDGGLTISDIQGLDGAKAKSGFNLGFYFDIKLKNPAWMINTGVLVKSPMGAKDLPVYSLDNPELDQVFEGGKVTTNLQYFQVPIMMKYLFKNHFYVKAGTQLALINKAFDEFIQTVETDDDLVYKIKRRDNYHPIDAGLAIGAGYRLMGGNGMNIGVQYYLGLIDITVDDQGPSQRNSAFYATVGIPIGKGAAQKKQKEKTSKQ